jgi:hypothetical protein
MQANPFASEDLTLFDAGIRSFFLPSFFRHWRRMFFAATSACSPAG